MHGYSEIYEEEAAIMMVDYGMTFEQFKEFVMRELKKGTLKVSSPLSELDMAIQYAIGMSRKKHMTIEDVYYSIIEYVGYVPEEGLLFWSPPNQEYTRN